MFIKTIVTANSSAFASVSGRYSEQNVSLLCHDRFFLKCKGIDQFSLYPFTMFSNIFLSETSEPLLNIYEDNQKWLMNVCYMNVFIHEKL